MLGDRDRAGDPVDGRQARTSEGALLDVRGVAAMLGCSARHVYRLSDSGRMPRPLRLGALVRWNRAAVLDWINAGCPAIRPVGASTSHNGGHNG